LSDGLILEPRGEIAPPWLLPHPTPIHMPVQSLESMPERTAPDIAPDRGFRAMGLIAISLAMTGVATGYLYNALAADTFGVLDLLILSVFTPLFAWTAFSFASAAAGLWATIRGYDPLGVGGGSSAPELSTRTALLAPIYNECPHAVCARLQAIWVSLEGTGARGFFDIFVLSDTTKPTIQAEEQAEIAALRRRLGPQARLFYRHRPNNYDRKAGNMGDWVRSFGGAYDHMVVLDADSLMEGETLVRLAAAMERNPRVGLIQTTPVVVNRHSLFGRTEQFASRLYGAVLARGIDWWSGSHGNYWGHNAIIRVKAFAEQAGLPHLPGRKPFGGHIMSHDFVEAALLRRAGWEVRIAPTLGGSYEESPPTLFDMIVRDRRWCQGNLQHLKVLGARGLSWISRWHLLRGVAAYLTAPLWLALLVMSALLPLKPEWGISDIDVASQMSATAGSAPGTIAIIFAISMGFLVAPKLIAYGAMLRSPAERRAFGGAGRAFASMSLEILLSALIAPVLMLNQIWALISILTGHDSGWGAQQREEGRIGLEDAANHHLGDTGVGLILTVASWGDSYQTLLWMTPVILGMVCCIPLAAFTASTALGEAARRAGLLVIPEEVDSPPVVATFNWLTHAAANDIPLTELRPASAA
jgi:membrane glycosyltransferase